MQIETTPLLADQKPSDSQAYREQAVEVNKVDNKFARSLSHQICHLLYLIFFNSNLND